MANPLSIQSKSESKEPTWRDFQEDLLQGAAMIETAYHIAQYIRTLMSKDPYCFCSHNNLEGPPNGYWIQTKKGLVIEEKWGIPSIIHTPIGAWNILYCTGGDFSMIFEITKRHLNLQPIDGPCAYGGSRLWAVTQWNSQKLEWPVYRTRGDVFLGKYDRTDLWQKFRKRHPDVRDPLRSE